MNLSAHRIKDIISVPPAGRGWGFTEDARSSRAGRVGPDDEDEDDWDEDPIEMRAPNL